MNFISVSFALFFAAVLLLLKVFPNQKTQQILLLCASYVFYAAWDWRFLALLAGISAAVWYLGGRIHRTDSKSALTVGVVLCVGCLGLFKYFNFFLDSFCALLHISSGTIQVILPLGLSFYIFQAVSYLCDVKNKKIPAASLPEVLLYIGFFPQIVSGPIVKARDFLPQLQRSHSITGENLSAGLQLFVVGMFKKVVIADRLGVCVDAVFSAPAAYSGLSLCVAVMAYAVQIYCDFSGYSDMAIGIARCMDFDLGRNFNMPYLAKNPSDFWRRWHISLSSWFRDYVYIPLGGSRNGAWRTYRNLFLTMLLSGLWHGANWTFLVWGAFHGIASMLHKAYVDFRKKHGPALRTGRLTELVSMMLNTLLVCLLWIPFRADQLSDAWMILCRIVTMADGIAYYYTYAVAFGLLMLAVNLLAWWKNDGNALWKPLDLRKFTAKVIFCVFLILIFLFAYIGDSAFLYAQF